MQIIGIRKLSTDLAHNESKVYLVILVRAKRQAEKLKNTRKGSGNSGKVTQNRPKTQEFFTFVTQKR